MRVRGIECGEKSGLSNQPTGGAMKCFITGLLLWFTITLPSSVRGAEAMEYRLLTFKDELKTAVKDDATWKICGDYFAASDSTEGKIVHFISERMVAEQLATTLSFVTIDRIIVSIEKEATTPTVSILWRGWNTRFVLKMNAKEYEAGLPCIAVKGTEV